MSMVVDVPAVADAEVRFRRDVGDEVVCGLDRLPIDDVLAGRPVRDFRWYKGRRFYSGWYWAATTGGLVAYESRLELARILLADFDPTVTGIAAQPFQLVGRDGDVLRRHVPDLLLRHASGEVIVVDVKPAHRVDDPSVAAVFGWTARVLASRGWRLEVWSGAAEPLLANIGFLAGYRRPEVVDQELVASVLSALAGRGTIGALERSVDAPAAVVRPVVLHLLWAGRLRTDLTRPLTASSVVTA